MRNVAGSLYGLAYGDSLGKPTEFQEYAEIVARYGAGGPTELTGDPALVTDDTQMMLAVGEALVAAGPLTPASFEPVLRQAFLDWAISPDNQTVSTYRGAVLLAVWIGVAALFRGISDLIVGFRLRSAHRQLETPRAAGIRR